MFLILFAAQNFLSRKRTEALKDVAVRLGMTFAGEDWGDGEKAPQLETPLFAEKAGSHFRNILSRGQGSVASSFFDYSFRKGRNVVQQTVAAFSRTAELPPFAIAPQSVLHKLEDKLLHREVRFESDAAFSERFYVTSADPGKAQMFFTPELRSFLVSLDPAAKWHVEGVGGTLVIYRPSKRVKPDEYPAFVDETARIADGFFDLAGVKQSANEG